MINKDRGSTRDTNSNQIRKITMDQYFNQYEMAWVVMAEIRVIGKDSALLWGEESIIRDEEQLPDGLKLRYILGPNPIGLCSDDAALFTNKAYNKLFSSCLTLRLEIIICII